VRVASTDGSRVDDGMRAHNGGSRSMLSSCGSAAARRAIRIDAPSDSSTRAWSAPSAPTAWASASRATSSTVSAVESRLASSARPPSVRASALSSEMTVRTATTVPSTSRTAV
jgi:hypothetical protein